MSRTIEYPGIEIHEIDRSKYGDNLVDESRVNTTSLLVGFAEKGEDYTTQWINTVETFHRVYGIPTNEAEKYFYNGAMEILRQGGVLVTAKLPYDNMAKDKFSFIKYEFDKNEKYIPSIQELLEQNIGGNTKPKEPLQLNFDTIYTDLKALWEHNGGSEQDIDVEEDINYNIALLRNHITDGYNAFTNDNMTIQEILEGLQEMSNSQTEPSDNFSLKEILLLDESFNFDENIAYKLYTDCKEYFLSTVSLDFVNYNSFLNVSVYDFFVEIKRILQEKNTEIYEQISSIYPTYEALMDKFLLSSSLTKIQEYFEDIINNNPDVKPLINDEAIQKIFDSKYTELRQLDSQITSYIDLNPNVRDNGIIDINSYDDFITGNQKPSLGSIMIVDKSRSKLEKERYGYELIGTVVCITTASNALYYQNLIQNDNINHSDYTLISHLKQMRKLDYNQNNDPQPITFLNNELLKLNDTETDTVKPEFTIDLGSELGLNGYSESLSKKAASYFNIINYKSNGFNNNMFKHIGVVVFQMYEDVSNGYKLNFTPVESFIGSLDKNAKDPITKQTIFIDNIVNSQSARINLFSNIPFSYAQNSSSATKTQFDKASIYVANNMEIMPLGFYNSYCTKEISVEKSIIEALNKIFMNNQDFNSVDLDLVIDGGISNIAQFIQSVYGHTTKKGEFTFDDEVSHRFSLNNQSDASTWLRVIAMFDEFCKNQRRDCMFLADGLRTLCLDGNVKRVRKTKPGNTIENSILPKLKYMSGMINSSYTAGYLNWFQAIDYNTGEYYWCPPSIKASGIYIKNDTYANFWNAPAGVNRGVVDNVIDVAFNPTQKNAGNLYVNQWNYAVNYPVEGIVIEGQKTFQIDKTALDRVNVRRLMLGIEKGVRELSRRFLYEGNTDFLRQRFVDLVDRFLYDIVVGGGISDYRILCDETNNTQENIENNELHMAIGVKPVKCIEFIVLNFVCTSQGADVEETIQGL